MIQLTPVLNKKELENINYFNSTPFSKAYKEKNETEIYNIIKSARAEKWLSNNKINSDEPDTYKNLIYNKPKENSPLSLFANSFLSSLPWWRTISKWVNILDKLSNYIAE